MSMINRNILITLIGLIALAGCAKNTEWQNPSKPARLWSSDARDCKRESNRLVNRELDNTSSVRDGERTTYDRQLARYDNSKRLKSFTDNCMASKGYRRVEIRSK